MRNMRRFCPDAATLAGWLEGKLDSFERTEVTRHLADCDRCRRASALAASIEPPDEVGIDEALLGRMVSTARRRPLLRWVAAAGVLAAAALSLFLLLPEQPDPKVTSHEKPESAPVVTVPGEEPPSVAPPGDGGVEVDWEPGPPSAAPFKEDAPKRPPSFSVPLRGVAAKGKIAPPVAEGPAEGTPPEPVVKELVGTTVPDLSNTFGRVFLNDSAGEIWMKRGGEVTSRVDHYVTPGPNDSLFTRDKGAGFTLEGRSTLVLERGTLASLSYFRPDDAYALSLRSGGVFIDTEGMEQRWHFFSGAVALSFSTLNGRVSVEPHDGRLMAFVLDGWGEVVSGKTKRRAEAGRVIELGADGKIELGRRGGSVTRKKQELYLSLKPPMLTVFEADFVKEEPPFPFEVTQGKLVRHADGAYLTATEVLPDPSYDREGPPVSRAELSLAKPIVSASSMVMRFRYRTTAERFRVRLGRYVLVYETPLRAGRWAEEEIPLGLFEDEGVEMIPTTELDAVAFETFFSEEGGRLDVDWVRFTRRSR